MIDDEFNNDLIAEINMAPLVDVVFVLLIIFMTTAPLLQRGIDVDLPASKTNTLKSEERVTIFVNEKGEIFLDDEKVLDNQLVAVLETIKLKNPEVTVYLKADKNVPYGKVITVMDGVKQVGIDKLGMVTERIVEDVNDSK